MAALAAVMAFVVLMAGKANPAGAVPAAINPLLINNLPTNANVAVPLSAQVTANFTDEGADFVMTSSLPAVGYFWGAQVTVNNSGQAITPTPAVQPTTITVADDTPDIVPQATAVVVNFLCVTAGVTTISYTQGGVTVATPLTITCTGGTTTITFAPTSSTIGVAVTVTAACTGAGQILTASAGSFVSTAPTNGTYNSPTQVTCLAAGNMVTTFTCTVASTTFTLNGVTNTLSCAGTTGGLAVSPTTGMTGTVTGTCTVGAPLTQTGPAQFVSATINGTPVTVTAGSITCTVAGTIIATFTCNTTGTVSLALGALTGTFFCSNTGLYGGIYGGSYNPYLNAYPTGCANGAYNTGAYPYNGAYNTGAYPYNQYANQYATTGCYNQQQYTNVPTSLTIATASPSVACGGTSQVTVRVLGTNGQTVTDGTAVALAASVGTLSPASASTTAGAVTATYTAPANVPATSVTLRATAGSASNTNGVSVTCAQTTAPATTAPVAPPSYSPPAPPAGLVISPPNTGDGGLLVAEMTNCGDVAS